jgi:hypothetical protein
MQLRQRLVLVVFLLGVLFMGATAAGRADTATQLPFTGGQVWMAVDAAGQHVFVSGGQGTSSIVVLNYDGSIAGTITGEGGASQMALNPSTHTLYVALHDATAISAIDTTTLTETKRFSTAPYASPTSLVIAAGELWFSCTANQTGCVVSANFDGSSQVSHGFIGKGGEAETTALAAGGSNSHILAVAELGSSPTTLGVYDVSAAPSLVSSTGDAGTCENGKSLAVDPAGTNVLLACGYPYHITSLSTSTLLSSATYPTGPYPQAVATTADGNFLAGGVNTGTGSGDDIFVFPTGNTTPVRTWSLGFGATLPGGLAFSPDASKLFAVVGTSGGQTLFESLDTPTVYAVETRLWLEPNPTAVYPGQPATLTAHVYGTTTGTVDLYATPSGGSKSFVASGSVGANGQVVFHVNPTVQTTYSAVLEARPGYAEATSPDQTITVLPPAQTTTSLSPAQLAIPAGSGAALTAYVTGTSTGTVDLYGTPSGSSKALVATKTVAGGSASFTVHPSVTTTYSAVLEAGQAYDSSTSADVTVTVIPRSMKISPAERSVTYGTKTELTVTTPPSGTVDLYAIPNGGSSVLLGTATVGAGKHSVTFTVKPTRKTTYFAELEDQTAASNDLTLVVRPSLKFAIAAKGRVLLVAAVMKPEVSGNPLVLEIDRNVKGKWRRFARGHIPARAFGALAFKVDGTYRAQVGFPGDDNYAAARSPWHHFEIRGGRGR